MMGLGTLYFSASRLATDGAAMSELRIPAPDPSQLFDRLPPHSIDWEFIAHALLFINLRTDRTGISGLSELLPGTRLAFTGATAAIGATWSPWDHAPVPGRLEQ